MRLTSLLRGAGESRDGLSSHNRCRSLHRKHIVHGRIDSCNGPKGGRYLRNGHKVCILANKEANFPILGNN